MEAMRLVDTALETVPDFPLIYRDALETLQVNLGYRCNQACSHCHVDAGPKRTEEMKRETVDVVLDFLAACKPKVLDLTGGAPELNPHFRYLVSEAAALGVAVIDRCNLTVLGEPGQETLGSFLAEHRVTVVASLPCYSRKNVDLQRGKGVFERSIEGLIMLNRLGYGGEGSPLELNLVHNPVDPILPPGQTALEAAYREVLWSDFGIRFNRLLTLCNMPIKRFRHALEGAGELVNYLDLLVGAFVPSNLETVMCRTLLSVDWRGYVYDCDFNQMLDLPVGAHARATHLSELMNDELTGQPITIAEHCYGCTAGQGSGCSGALSD